MHTDGPFGAAHVNVTAQRNDPQSPMGVLTRIISARRAEKHERKRYQG